MKEVIHASPIKHTDPHYGRGSFSASVEKERVIVCPRCHNVKHGHTWFAPDSKVGLLSGFRRKEIENKNCPACDMQIHGRHGAEVFIHDVPHRYRFQVEWLIENEARSALFHDPQDRLLDVMATIDGFEVHTVGPKLARAIGKRIQNNFKTSEVQSKYRPTPFPLYHTNVQVKVDEYFNQ